MENHPCRKRWGILFSEQSGRPSKCGYNSLSRQWPPLAHNLCRWLEDEESDEHDISERRTRSCFDWRPWVTAWIELLSPARRRASMSRRWSRWTSGSSIHDGNECWGKKWHISFDFPRAQLSKGVAPSVRSVYWAPNPAWHACAILSLSQVSINAVNLRQGEGFWSVDVLDQEVGFLSILGLEEVVDKVSHTSHGWLIMRKRKKGEKGAKTKRGACLRWCIFLLSKWATTAGLHSPYEWSVHYLLSLSTAVICPKIPTRPDFQPFALHLGHLYPDKEETSLRHFPWGPGGVNLLEDLVRALEGPFHLACHLWQFRDILMYDLIWPCLGVNVQSQRQQPMRRHCLCTCQPALPKGRTVQASSTYAWEFRSIEDRQRRYTGVNRNRQSKSFLKCIHKWELIEKKCGDR